jgi:hypothetical protein
LVFYIKVVYGLRIFENKILRRIFGPEREEQEAGENYLYFSLDIIRMIKSSWMRGAEHVSHMFFYLVCEAIGTAAIPGLLCQPQVIVKMIVEKQMECKLAGETEVIGKNLPQRHFCSSQNPT